MNISFARSDQLSWQQFADNNVLLIGSPSTLGDQMLGMTTREELVLDKDGVRNLRPQPGESLYFADRDNGISPTASEDTGDGYALITHTPGPLGRGDVQSFASNSTPGRTASVQWFTDAALARVLIGKLKNDLVKSRVIIRFCSRSGLRTAFRSRRRTFSIGSCRSPSTQSRQRNKIVGSSGYIAA